MDIYKSLDYYEENMGILINYVYTVYKTIGLPNRFL